MLPQPRQSTATAPLRRVPFQAVRELEEMPHHADRHSADGLPAPWPHTPSLSLACLVAIIPSVQSLS